MSERENDERGSDDRKPAYLEVQADFQQLEEGQERPPTRAYLLSSSGELVDSQPLDEGGRARFQAEAGDDEGRRYQVVIGPDTEDVHRLAEWKAQRQFVSLEPGARQKLDFDLAKAYWHCWYGVLYSIVGNVQKRIQVAGGETLHLPICDAKVEIYEVDVKLCLQRLPDRVLEEIRRGLLRDFPPPPPPPFERRERFERVERVAAEPAAAGHAERKADFSGLVTAAGLSDGAIRAASTVQLRQLLLDNYKALKPILCFYLAPPFCYKTTLIATATTDADGNFARLYGMLCPTDEPDLYFKVKQWIGGQWKTIYAPTPVPCHTYWNYVSGTEVSIVVTDPAAVACDHPTPPDKAGCYVMPLGIGFDGWYEVEDAHVKTPGLIGLFPNRGLYNASDPYGKTLDLTMQFHDGLRGRGVWFYRWSYRKEGTAGWTQIDAPITHRYLDASVPAIKSHDLGPKSAGSEGNLFLVPDPNLTYVQISAMDRSFARWDTSALSAGKYELRLQLFDAGGNPVKPKDSPPVGLTEKDFKYFLPTGPVAGEWPVDDNLHVASDGSLRLRLHLDNEDTVAKIKALKIVGGAAAGDCQFLEYDDKATDDLEVTYEAYHPNGHLASYSLSIKKGISGTTVASHGSSVPALPPGVDRQFPVQDLLGADSKCAFALNLHTYPTTRNGYSRIREYEAHAVSAFALVAK